MSAGPGENHADRFAAKLLAVILGDGVEHGDELGGHMVSGHVDGVAEVMAREDGISSWAYAHQRELDVAVGLLDDPIGVDHAHRVLPRVEPRHLEHERPADVSDEILQFVRFWSKHTGRPPAELVFDSQLTTYQKLSQLNSNKSSDMPQSI